MSSKQIILAKIKKFGSNFEISIDPDKAVAFKAENGQGSIDIREVLLVEEIFSDAKKGQVSSSSELEKAFASSDVLEVAKKIILEGEIQVNSSHRAKEREERRLKLIDMIHQMVVDPKTGLVHPKTRIENALVEAKVQLVDHKSVEKQFDEIISKLRPIIPIKIEMKTVSLDINGAHVGKLNSVIRSGGSWTLKKEEWTNSGNWKVELEMPAGIVANFIEKINSFSRGEVAVEIKE